MTYSIVARDPETGDMGVAVQSMWFSVGRGVLWTNAGVGVVATQAFMDPTYGAKGLTLMRAGLNAEKTLDNLLELDEGRELRQVAMVDAKGIVAAFTGEKCMKYAAHCVSGQASAQGNILATPGMPEKMIEAYESAEGDLAHRLLAALEAAEAAGGDARGSQSAALQVVVGKGKRDLFADRPYDIRIDDHPDPIAELRRIMNVQSAYRLLEQSNDHYSIGDFELAADQANQAFELLPGDSNVAIFGAVALYERGEIDRAREMVMACKNPPIPWEELFARLANSDLLPKGIDIAEFTRNVTQPAAAQS